MFKTSLEKIIEKVGQIDPVRYGKTRNFLNGDVTRLSPYISRGVISTRFVLKEILARRFKYYEIEKFLMELAWRDYFQNVWLTKNIDNEIKHPQTAVNSFSMPKAVLNAATGIDGIDSGVNDLYETGYVHNHQRMYIASVVTNLARNYWKIPAQWFYFHLLDADWASNACSWQWVCGAFSSKKYYANQENINRYCGTDQHGTFLDHEYSEFADLQIPQVLQDTEIPILQTNLPKKEVIEIDTSLPTLVYNFYNLDPFWRNKLKANRVLLLEPSHFRKYPVSDKTIDFVMKLADNIDRIQIYVGEFDEFKTEFNMSEIYFKEHPTNAHYLGTQDRRDWMFPEISGYFPSFFAYWKKCEPFLKSEFN